MLKTNYRSPYNSGASGLEKQGELTERETRLLGATALGTAGVPVTGASVQAAATIRKARKNKEQAKN